MKAFSFSLLSLLLAATAGAQATFHLETGASYFALRGARFEAHPAPFKVDEGSRFAPFVAAGYAFNERWALRASYHYLSDVTATAAFGHQPGPPGQVVLPVVVHGQYREDIHVVGLAPELRWGLSPRLRVTVSPVLNWVASRAEVRYSSNLQTFAPVPNRRRRDDGFTFGGSIGLEWGLSAHAALTLGYLYTDLDPSFDREAHVFSGGFRWTF